LRKHLKGYSLGENDERLISINLFNSDGLMAHHKRVLREAAHPFTHKPNRSDSPWTLFAAASRPASQPACPGHFGAGSAAWLERGADADGHRGGATPLPVIGADLPLPEVRLFGGSMFVPTQAQGKITPIY
jgi:hypothetical protein